MRLNGRFGAYGGTYVPEILMPALVELEAAFLDAQDDPDFQAELAELLPNMPAGRRRSPAAAISAMIARAST
jgi:tryptophan synthase beta chain